MKIKRAIAITWVSFLGALAALSVGYLLIMFIKNIIENWQFWGGCVVFLSVILGLVWLTIWSFENYKGK